MEYTYRENETPEQRKKRLEADQKAKEALKKRNAGSIRCYGGQGFTTTVTRPDGKKVTKYVYGREGD